MFPRVRYWSNVSKPKNHILNIFRMGVFFNFLKNYSLGYCVCFHSWNLRVLVIFLRNIARNFLIRVLPLLGDIVILDGWIAFIEDFVLDSKKVVILAFLHILNYSFTVFFVNIKLNKTTGPVVYPTIKQMC